MARKKQFPKPDLINSIPPTTTITPKKFSFSGDLLTILFCVLYFIVEFIPGMGGVDDMGSQWFYIVTLNFIVAMYILNRKKPFELPFLQTVKSSFSKLYLSLFLLAGVSVLFSINHTEGWVCYARMIATVIAFFNITLLLFEKMYLFTLLAQILSVILLIQSIQALSVFLTGMQSYRLTELILAMKGYAGNKNIFATSLLTKIPFVLFGIYSTRLPGKIINGIIFFIASLTIILLNSRTNYLCLALETISFLAICLVQISKRKNSVENFQRISIVVVLLAISFFISITLITAAKNSFQDSAVDANQYGSVVERISSISSANDESNQQRIFLWSNAADYAKKHPFMGCGYGNWKIASVPYVKYFMDEYWIPIHAHNDFLETFAELGFAGGLLFISLFICIIFYTIKTCFSGAKAEVKLIAFFSALGLLGYSIDAIFNFPQERPSSQIYFVFFVALNLLAYNSAKRNEATESEKVANGNSKLIFGFIVIVLTLPAAYYTFFSYISLVAQDKILSDLTNQPSKLTVNEVRNAYYEVPNLCFTARSMDEIVGKYYYENKNYEQAIKFLDKGSAASPYVMYSEFLKSKVYYDMNQMDSSFKYANMAFFNRPRVKDFYQMLIAVSSKRADTATITNAFRLFSKYRTKDPDAWNLYLKGRFYSNNSASSELISVADSALKLFPANKELIDTRNEMMSSKQQAGGTIVYSYQYYAEGITLFNSGQYEKAAQKFIKSAESGQVNYLAYEMTALCYFNLKQWEKTLPYFNKAISMKTATDGKSEYFKGAALIYLNRKDEACPVLAIAKKKNYPGVDDLISANCK